MAALKTATKGLLSQLQGAVTQPGDVYVSIVPFVKDVNLGASNWNANWIYWGSSTQDPGETDNTSWEALHGTCDSNYNNDRSRCRTRGGVCSNTSFTRQSTCTTSGTCSVGSPMSQSTCESRGTCSVAGNSTQTACNSAGTCSLASYTTQTGCQNAGFCDISGNNSHLAARCLDLDPQDMDAGELDPRDLYRVHLDAGHLGACEPQYVERLRDGSRQLERTGRDL
jgi:hypothetical protein